jgi:hypothetical protein
LGGVGTILALLALFEPPPPLGDAAAFPPSGYWGDLHMPSLKSILVYREELTYEDQILSVQLWGAGPEAAWAVLLPSAPEVNPASPGWLVLLSDLTHPRSSRPPT